jgi:hypothetical protein
MIFKKKKNAAEIFESLPQELKVAYFQDWVVQDSIRRSQCDSCDLQEAMTRLATDLYRSHKAFRERELKRAEKEMDLTAIAKAKWGSTEPFPFRVPD